MGLLSGRPPHGVVVACPQQPNNTMGALLVS